MTVDNGAAAQPSQPAIKQLTMAGGCQKEGCQSCEHFNALSMEGFTDLDGTLVVEITTNSVEGDFGPTFTAETADCLMSIASELADAAKWLKRG